MVPIPGYHFLVVFFFFFFFFFFCQIFWGLLWISFKSWFLISPGFRWYTLWDKSLERLGTYLQCPWFLYRDRLASQNEWEVSRPLQYCGRDYVKLRLILLAWRFLCWELLNCKFIFFNSYGGFRMICVISVEHELAFRRWSTSFRFVFIF